MSIDVSPDGKTLIFDLLGDIYVIPIEGGTARALRIPLAVPQGLWAAGIGAFCGGHLAALMGRRASYFAISVGSLAVNFSIFYFLTPASPS